MLRKLSLGFLVLAACGSARVVSRNQSGGVIELSGDRGKAMEQANQEMSAHCGPNNYQIVQEGEEAIGTDTVVQEDTATDSRNSRNGRRNSSDSSTTQTAQTRTATAWRVHYQCNGAGGPPPPMGAPGGDPNGPPPNGPPPAGDAGGVSQPGY